MKFRLVNHQCHYLISRDFSPLMTTDVSEASLFELDEALENVSKIRKQGIEIFLDPIIERD